MRVAIVGGGVIGLCCAHALRKRGASVIVLDRGACGSGASCGNGGWVTPGLSAPIPGPGVLRQAARWMLNRESPLLVRPRADAAFLRWTYGFWRACDPAAHRAGTAATLELAREATAQFDALLADGVRFEHHDDGLLYLARDAEHLEEWLDAYALLGELGFDGALTTLDARDVRALEPSVSDAVVGGLLGGRERHVRPESLIAGLCAALGPAIQEQTEVSRLRPRGDGWRVETQHGAIDVDRVVVAAGVWTPGLLARLGVRLPMQAAKGYSITSGRGDCPPQRALYLTEAKVGVSPYDDAVRVAGTLELAGLDEAIDHRRVAAVERAAREYLPGWRPGRERSVWAGLRPLAPDGLPVIGGVPGHEGLFVATAHGMLGVTLGPATGEALAPAVLGDDATVPAALTPARFGAARRPQASRSSARSSSAITSRSSASSRSSPTSSASLRRR